MLLLTCLLTAKPETVYCFLFLKLSFQFIANVYFQNNPTEFWTFTWNNLAFIKPSWGKEAQTRWWNQNDSSAPPHENTKITTNCWTTINKIDWQLPKKKKKRYPTPKSYTPTLKMVGGVLSQYKQSHNWQVGNAPGKKLYHRDSPKEWEFQTPHEVPWTGVLAPGVLGIEGHQWGLSARALQDWGKQRLYPWRAHTAFHVNWVSGQSRDSIKIRVRPTCRSWRVF